MIPGLIRCVTSANATVFSACPIFVGVVGLHNDLGGHAHLTSTLPRKWHLTTLNPVINLNLRLKVGITGAVYILSELLDSPVYIICTKCVAVP